MVGISYRTGTITSEVIVSLHQRDYMRAQERTNTRPINGYRIEKRYDESGRSVIAVSESIPLPFNHPRPDKFTISCDLCDVRYHEVVRYESGDPTPIESALARLSSQLIHHYLGSHHDVISSPRREMIQCPNCGVEFVTVNGVVVRHG